MFMHNVCVATTRERSFMQLHGEEVVLMSVPLFQAGREFNVLNNQVLSAEVTGGGPQERRSGIFRETEEGDPMGGGISLPVQGPGQDGNYFVDDAGAGGNVSFGEATGDSRGWWRVSRRPRLSRGGGC